MMNKETFEIKLIEFLDKNQFAKAGINEDYNNRNLSWVRFVFTDDQPNLNHQVIPQDEFPNIIRSMVFMPIKANFDIELGVQGHDDTDVIGVIKQGQQEANKVMGIGALYKKEYPELIKFFEDELENGNAVNFSWELQYGDYEEKDGNTYMKDITTVGVVVVSQPAYAGRTALLAIAEKRQNETKMNARRQEVENAGLIWVGDEDYWMQFNDKQFHTTVLNFAVVVMEAKAAVDSAENNILKVPPIFFTSEDDDDTPADVIRKELKRRRNGNKQGEQ